jgi:nicotinamidase/pyrazinamidase
MDAIRLARGDALLVVDVQNDFLPGGALAVPRGDEILAPLNGYLKQFVRRSLPIFATRDWHPSGHCSFREQNGPWPPHCIAGSEGARFAAALQLPTDAILVAKATDVDTDAYSGFAGTDLENLLREGGVRRLFVGGLATDYCVLNTVRDAARLGYAVMLLHDAVRAVDMNPGDGDRALAEMRALGARSIELSQLTA